MGIGKESKQRKAKEAKQEHQEWGQHRQSKTRLFP
jgi:hypothetical protein